MKFKMGKEWFEKSAKLEEECEPGGILACSPEIYKEMCAANEKFAKLSLKEKIEHLDKEIKQDEEDYRKFLELRNNIENSLPMKKWEKEATDKFVAEQFKLHEIKK